MLLHPTVSSQCIHQKLHLKPTLNWRNCSRIVYCTESKKNIGWGRTEMFAKELKITDFKFSDRSTSVPEPQPVWLCACEEVVDDFCHEDYHNGQHPRSGYDEDPLEENDWEGLFICLGQDPVQKEIRFIFILSLIQYCSFSFLNTVKDHCEALSLLHTHKRGLR